MSAINKDIVAKVNAAFADGNVDGFLAYCADDVAWTIVGDTTVQGKDAIRQWMASMGPMEPPTFTVAHVLAEGDFVTAYGDMTMQDKDGKVVPYAYCDIYRFQGDQIVELRAFVIKTAAHDPTSSRVS
jgi:prepilin-type processing-associated H-X9-DG protein